MRRLTILNLVVLVVAAGCSDRATDSDSGGSKWPEASVDLGPDSGPDARPPDLAVVDLAAVDLPRPDRGPDAPGVDLIKPDVLSPDLPQPDLPPPPTWKAATSATTVDLHGVACSNGHVFAAGDKGTIVHHGPSSSTATFAAQTSNIASDLYTVSFYYDSTTKKSYGAAGGNNLYIMDTQDWGKTWAIAPQCSAYFFDNFYSLYVYSLSKGLGAGDAEKKQGGGMKYFNGGSWICSSPTYAKEVMYGTFQLGTSGWTVGDTGGKIYYSVNDGVNWKTATLPVKEVLRDVHFASAKLGLAVGQKGTILRSVDGKGLVWKKVTSPGVVDLYDVFLWDAKNAWIVGDKGTILHSTDGGASWSAQKSGSTKRLEGVCFNSAQSGFAVGAGGTVLYTTTGGK